MLHLYGNKVSRKSLVVSDKSSTPGRQPVGGEQTAGSRKCPVRWLCAAGLRMALAVGLLAGVEETAEAQFLNNADGIDKEWYNFGFLLSINIHSFDVVKEANYTADFSREYENESGYIADVPPLAAVRPVPKPGFNLGLLANLKLHANFDLRFTPNIVFTDSDMEYVYQDGSQPEMVNTRITNIQLPMLLKFKSNRQKNIRVFLTGGVKYIADVTSRKRYDQALEVATQDPGVPVDAWENSAVGPVFLDRNIWAWEAGVGVDLYFEFFKCSPELKFSRSFNNVLLQTGNRYSRPLAGLFAEMVQFTIHFE